MHQSELLLLIPPSYPNRFLSGLQNKEVQERLKASGILIYPGNVEVLRKFVISESEEWRGLVKDANIQPE